MKNDSNESPSNGKGKLELKNQQAVIFADEEMRKALAKDDSLSEVNEPTKYILLDNALVESVFDDRVKHFTKYLNIDEVVQMNDVETHARLIPVVIKSKNPAVNERIKAIADIFINHTHDHMDNMMSLDNKSGNTAKLMVLALKADNQPYPDGKELKKMFGK